jgi:hypothetical protein
VAARRTFWAIVQRVLETAPASDPRVNLGLFRPITGAVAQNGIRERILEAYA